MITQEGKISIDPDNGVQYAGFRFGIKLDETDKCVAIIDYAIAYLQGVRHNIVEEGLPPDFGHPKAEILDFGAFKSKKQVELASDTQPASKQE